MKGKIQKYEKFLSSFKSSYFELFSLRSPIKGETGLKVSLQVGPQVEYVNVKISHMHTGEKSKYMRPLKMEWVFQRMIRQRKTLSLDVF